MFTSIPYIKLVAQISFVHSRLDQHIKNCIKKESLDITKVRAMILNQIQFKGFISQKTIAELNNLTPQAIHRHVKILEQKEYIIRKKSINDKREQNFLLTKTGKILVSKARKVFINAIKEFFSGLDKQERKTLTLLLSKVKDFNIEKIILNK